MYLNRREMVRPAYMPHSLPATDRTSGRSLPGSRTMRRNCSRLLRDYVTEETAQKYGFLSNIVRALEMKGYGPRIRFKDKTGNPAAHFVN